MTREHNRPAGMQARAACVAPLLRRLHATVLLRVGWNPPTSPPDADRCPGRLPRPTSGLLREGWLISVAGSVALSSGF